ncbi:hypothetical protein GCM10028805_02830 [Spirosoma harenae]
MNYTIVVNAICIACLLGCNVLTTFGQEINLREEREFGVIPLIGLNKPDRIMPASTQAPIGLELRYSRLHMSQQSWEQCQCFFRSGAFFNTYSFRNPVALGQSYGGGLFFEPVLAQGPHLGLSLRALAGLTYVTRYHDPITNPGNDAFGTPLEGLIGVGLYARYTIATNWRLLLGFDYKHISNAGVKLPNQGLNIPALSIGITRFTGEGKLPSTQTWEPSRAYKRWMFRVMALASLKILEGTDKIPDQSYPIYGLNLLAGYHLTRSHVLSGGIELVDDHYFKEQINRWTKGQNIAYRQGTILIGYEFWQGHFSFTAHWGWNIVRPLWYKPANYQKYGLLYRFTNGLTGGVAVKAYGDDTKNFQAVVGMTF